MRTAACMQDLNRVIVIPNGGANIPQCSATLARTRLLTKAWSQKVSTQAHVVCLLLGPVRGWDGDPAAAAY